MRILHIIPSLRKGGAERVVLDICNELHSRKFDVKVLTFNPENAYSNFTKFKHDVIPVDIHLSITGKSVINDEELHRYIQEFSPQIIHTHLFNAEISCRWTLHEDIKYFSHCHDNMPQLKKFSLHDLFSKKRITQLYERNILLRQYARSNNYFVTISKHTQTYYKKNLPKKFWRRISLLFNSIDCVKFFNTKNARPKILTLINIGNFLPKKNPLFLAEIANEIFKRGVPFKIIMLGDGVQKNKLVQSLKADNLLDFFEFPGFVDDVNLWLNKSSIYVHTAVYEPFGLVLLEAMSAGLPVVALNGGGNVDIMKNGENGFIIDEQNSQLFAERILEVWKNEQLYKKMSSHAQVYAKQHDIKEYVDSLLDLYKR